MDKQIRPDAWAPISPVNPPAAYRKLGAKRLADANELAPWAGRSALEGYCREVKSIRLGADATRKQLSWSIKCDDTLGLSISEKGALKTRHRLDPTRYARDGSELSDMYRKPEPADQVDVEKTAATIINLNRHLCARVTNIAPLQMREGVYEVTCVKYRGGAGTVRYLLDAPKGIASPL
ncbi:hypothetical protein NF699_07955 [Sphingomonadaceae bacterium OTU29LAMAA1]|nr:hypothetical protein NF699_07955 [Sphingomonadaceae bacterium OTU29LAMAA1]